MALSCASSCRTGSGVPGEERIPRGESCLITSTEYAFCVDQRDDTERDIAVSDMVGSECVTLDYRNELEFFIYDLLKEINSLKAKCGSKCKENE